MQGAGASAGWGKKCLACGMGQKVLGLRDGAKSTWPARRSVFSVCGKLVGHFPVCGWLRVAMVAIKRRATSVSSGWDNEVRDAALRSMQTETVAWVTHDDPVRGNWCVDRNEFTVWVDASSLALGVALAVDEFIV